MEAGGSGNSAKIVKEGWLQKRGNNWASLKCACQRLSTLVNACQRLSTLVNAYHAYQRLP